MNKLSATKKWFIAMSAAAFISIISFFQINSYGADKNNLNGFWLISGLVFGVAACYCLYKVTKTAGGNTGFK